MVVVVVAVVVVVVVVASVLAVPESTRESLSSMAATMVAMKKVIWRLSDMDGILLRGNSGGGAGLNLIGHRDGRVELVRHGRG